MADAEKVSRKDGGELTVTPSFMLLFSIEMKSAFPGFAFPVPGVSALPQEQARAYADQLTEFEERLLGEPFRAARRIVHWPLGRIALAGGSDTSPPYADVFLLEHKSGVALWEVWLPAPEQPFDAMRWLAWLDSDTENGLIADLWRVLSPINQALSGESNRSGTYFPVTVLRLPQHPLAAVIERHAPDLVRLLFLNHAQWTLKPEVIRAELEQDYCAREGGMTLLSRRSGLDLHARESLATEEAALGLPPRTALPFVITVELLLLERAVLQLLYKRLSRAMPSSIDELLVLKQEMLDALEEYYGAITTATRFGDAVTADGERLLGILDLYDAVTNRLAAVSFEITTRYQRRTTILQFWLTIVFGATGIGFMALAIATWYYQTGLVAVIAWTVGTTLVAGAVLVALLKGELK